MHFKKLGIGLVVATLLAGCLDNDLERGAAGAAGGAIIASTTGGSVLGGAVLGGAAGIICDDINICN